MNALRHVLRRALRSLWENFYLNCVSIGVIAAALLLMGVYLTIQYNVNVIVDTWNRDVHISAYFHPDVPEQRRFGIRDRIAQDARVSQVRYVAEEDARDWLVDQVDGIDTILSELGPGVLPASLEITLGSETSHPTAIADFAAEIEGSDFKEVDYGQEWTEKFNAFLSLLKLLGAILGILILVSALFLVMNTVHLVLYNRRDELETQKLVGASNVFIATPFMIEGIMQGAIGGALSLAGLWTVHKLLVIRLQEALRLGIAGGFQFLPGAWLALLCIAGIVLGLGAALVAVQRFLSQAQ